MFLGFCGSMSVVLKKDCFSHLGPSTAAPASFRSVWWKSVGKSSHAAWVWRMRESGGRGGFRSLGTERRKGCLWRCSVFLSSFLELIHSTLFLSCSLGCLDCKVSLKACVAEDGEGEAPLLFSMPRLLSPTLSAVVYTCTVLQCSVPPPPCVWVSVCPFQFQWRS